MGRQGYRRGCDGIIILDPFLCQPVYNGSLSKFIPVGPKVVSSQGVNRYDQDVRTVLRRMNQYKRDQQVAEDQREDDVSHVGSEPGSARILYFRQMHNVIDIVDSILYIMQHVDPKRSEGVI